jgi:hypothetical protein
VAESEISRLEEKEKGDFLLFNPPANNQEDVEDKAKHIVSYPAQYRDARGEDTITLHLRYDLRILFWSTIFLTFSEVTKFA